MRCRKNLLERERKSFFHAQWWHHNQWPMTTNIIFPSSRAQNVQWKRKTFSRVASTKHTRGVSVGLCYSIGTISFRLALTHFFFKLLFSFFFLSVFLVENFPKAAKFPGNLVPAIQHILYPKVFHTLIVISELWKVIKDGLWRKLIMGFSLKQYEIRNEMGRDFFQYEKSDH